MVQKWAAHFAGLVPAWGMDLGGGVSQHPFPVSPSFPAYEPEGGDCQTPPVPIKRLAGWCYEGRMPPPPPERHVKPWHVPGPATEGEPSRLPPPLGGDGL